MGCHLMYLRVRFQRFAEDPALLRRYGENALRFAQTELGWDRLAPRYAKVLEAVMIGQRSQAGQHG